MEFTKTYNELKGIFSLDSEKMQVKESGIDIWNLKFSSVSGLSLPPNGVDEESLYRQNIAAADEDIPENKTFSYPVFTPRCSNAHGKAIILLHGLNERSWLKYLPWAYYLAEKMNRPVILFPISFHMNRSPEKWANPRAMMPLLGNRQKIKALNSSTFANVALSQRLSDDPLRFFASGKQSAEDLVQLLETIKQGDHPFLARDSQIDFFSYSIGAFLSQILFLANPKGLLCNSRLHMFCGGAHFSEMFGTSRLIMDSNAFSCLRKYYLTDFLKELKSSTPFSCYFMENEIGKAFLAMLSPECNRKFRESRLKELSEQMRVITLKKDRVIPSNFVQSTFSAVKGKVRHMVQELDFTYEYSHEVPFPIWSNPNFALVDQCFDRAFQPAVEFLR